MRRKLTIAAVTAALMLGGGSAALANNGRGPDPTGPAGYGLCTAWSNNGNGRENGNAENSTAFGNLQEAAEAQDQTVEEFCADVFAAGPGGGNAGGRGPQG